MTFENHGAVADQGVDAGCSCEPLELTFTGIVFPDQGLNATEEFKSL